MKKFTVLILALAAVCICLTGCKSETVPEDAYYLVIGEDGVKEINVSTPDGGGGVVHADGSVFKKGEKVWLEQLDGISSLRGVSIRAAGEDGETVYTFHIPENADDGDIVKLILGDTWFVAPTRK